MKDLIEQLRIVATRWERENPIIGVGNLRYCDALRDAADAIEKQEAENAHLRRERDAAVAVMKIFADDDGGVLRLCIE